MRNFGASAGQQSASTAAGVGRRLGLDRQIQVSGGPSNGSCWGGALLIAAIAIGTAGMVGSFRERALANGERELGIP